MLILGALPDASEKRSGRLLMMKTMITAKTAIRELLICLAPNIEPP
jgi:hypothetical protein